MSAFGHRDFKEFVTGQRNDEFQDLPHPNNARPLAPVLGIEHPDADDVTAISMMDNIELFSPQLEAHVLRVPRMPKMVFPDGTGRGPSNGRKLKALMVFPGTNNPMGHDPIEDSASTATDYVSEPEGHLPQRHPRCPDFCTGGCGGYCNLQHHRLANNERTDFPKMGSTVQDLGVTVREPGSPGTGSPRRTYR
jgi:hypothetical protein